MEKDQSRRFLPIFCRESRSKNDQCHSVVSSALMRQLFNDTQLDRLSETLSNFGLLLFASMVIPAFTEVGRVDPFKVLLGWIGGLSSFMISLLLLKGVEK